MVTDRLTQEGMDEVEVVVMELESLIQFVLGAQDPKCSCRCSSHTPHPNLNPNPYPKPEPDLNPNPNPNPNPSLWNPSGGNLVTTVASSLIRTI